MKTSDAHSTALEGSLCVRKVTPCCLLAKPLASLPRGVPGGGGKVQRPCVLRSPLTRCPLPVNLSYCRPQRGGLINLFRVSPEPSPCHSLSAVPPRDSRPRRGRYLGCRTFWVSVLPRLFLTGVAHTDCMFSSSRLRCDAMRCNKRRILKACVCRLVRGADERLPSARPSASAGNTAQRRCAHVPCTQ